MWRMTGIPGQRCSLQGPGQQGTVVHVDEIRLHPGDDLGHRLIIDRKILAVAADRASGARPCQGNAKIFHPLAHFVVGQFRVRDPDDHGPPGLEASRGLLDKQLGGAAPDGGDGIEFGADKGDGRHKSSYQVSSFRFQCRGPAMAASTFNLINITE